VKKISWKKDFCEKILLKKNCGASRLSEWVVKRPALREIRACGARSPSRERSGGAHLLLAEEMHQLRAVQRHEDVTRCVSSSKSHIVVANRCPLAQASSPGRTIQNISRISKIRNQKRRKQIQEFIFFFSREMFWMVLPGLDAFARGRPFIGYWDLGRILGRGGRGGKSPKRWDRKGSFFRVFTLLFLFKLRFLDKSSSIFGRFAIFRFLIGKRIWENWKIDENPVSAGVFCIFFSIFGIWRF